MLVHIYNIDKLKRVSEQIKKRTAGTARNAQFVITLLKLTKERSAFIIYDKCKKDK